MGSFDVNSNYINFVLLSNLHVMKFSIELTWSKLIAVLVLAGAVYLDLKAGTGATAFMFSLPFIVFLITGKQYLDKK